MELPGAVKGRGIEIDVIVEVALVCVGADKKLILSLCPAHGRFIADLVGLLRCHFAGRKRLPDLEEQGATLCRSSRFRLVLTFYQKKLSGSSGRIAEMGGHSPQLFRVEPIGKPLLHRLNCSRFRRHLIGPDICCGRNDPSSLYAAISTSRYIVSRFDFYHLS